MTPAMAVWFSIAAGVLAGGMAGLGLHRAWAVFSGGSAGPGGRMRWGMVAVAALVGAGSGALAGKGWDVVLAAAVLGWLLLLLAVLDITHFWLPDRLTAPLALAGLAAQAAGIGPGLADGLLAMASGYAALWLVGAVYRRLRGHEGLGGGDPKMLAAIGAWLSPLALPWLLVLASALGLAAMVIVRMAGGSPGRFTRLPFGALMAGAAWPLWLGAQLA